jgi:DNA-directed RNA polymerase specialized sigma subunit
MAFEQEHERSPSDDELAAILDFNLSDIRSSIASHKHHVSLDSPI